MEGTYIIDELTLTGGDDGANRTLLVRKVSKMVKSRWTALNRRTGNYRATRETNSTWHKQLQIHVELERPPSTSFATYPFSLHARL